MKKKFFMILALVMATMTASAMAGYNLTVGKCEHGSITFKVNGTAVTSAVEGQTVTVELTPETGWTEEILTGRWYAAVAAGKAVGNAETIDMLEYFEPTPVEGKENTYTFTMQRANAEINVEFRKDFSNPDIVVYAIADVPYTGWEVAPIAIVRDGDTYLKEGVDFIVTCTNSVEIGPSVATVTGIGKYSGEVKRTFNIVVNKNNLENALIIANHYYNSILASYPNIAAQLKASIDDAMLVMADKDATQENVDAMIESLILAVDEAVEDVKEAQETGIDLAPAAAEGEGEWYDLQGRRIAKPTTKGMYILNGKKIAF